MIPPVFAYWYWLVLLVVSVCIHVRLRRVQARGRACWLVGVLLYGFACTFGSYWDYYPVYELFGANVSGHFRRMVLTTDNPQEAYDYLGALGYISGTTAPASFPSMPGPLTTSRAATSTTQHRPQPFQQPVSSLRLLLPTAIRTALVLVAVWCMWAGLTRINKHGCFGAKPSEACCPKCGCAIQPSPGSSCHCPQCGLKIIVKRIIKTRQSQTLSGSMP